MISLRKMCQLILTISEGSEKREKSSIMDRLKAAKSSKPQVKSAPSKEKKSERDL